MSRPETQQQQQQQQYAPPALFGAAQSRPRYSVLNAHKASREAGVYLVFANYVPAEHGGNDNIYVETQTCTQDSGLADSTAAKLGSIPGAIRSGVTKESGGYRPWALLPGEMKYCK